MAWWVYKCNGKNRDHQRDFGDWRSIFDSFRVQRWGTTELLPQLEKLTPGDMVIAYQTDRNELVGVCRMVRFQKDGPFKIVMLEPLENVGTTVRPLKQADRKIAAIPALQPGPIMTLYSISEEDAKRLLKAAGASTFVGPKIQPANPDSDVLEQTFLEGAKRAAASTVRSPTLRAAAKIRWGLQCYCCGFDFERFYGKKAKGLAVVHHLETFDSGGVQKRKSSTENVRVVCANCHLVIHVETPPIGVDELKELISKSWLPWSEKGIAPRQ